MGLRSKKNGTVELALHLPVAQKPNRKPGCDFVATHHAISWYRTLGAMIPVRDFNFIESKSRTVLKLEIWITISLTSFQMCLEHPK
jgi:hypothetical protein